MQETPTDYVHGTQPAVRPLFRFFLRSRVGKGQFLMAAMFVATMGLLSYYSEQLSGSLDIRVVTYWAMAMVLWPLWLADDDFKPMGAVRLFVTPRYRMRSVILAYIFARNFFAILVAIFSALILFNVEIGEAGFRTVLRTLAASIGACLLIVNVANYWGMLVRGKVIVLMIFLTLFAVARLGAVLEGGGMATIVSTILGPVWIVTAGFDPSFFDENAWHLYQVVTASVFWGWLSFREFTRQYRTTNFFGRTSV